MSAYAKVVFCLGILSILWRVIWHGFDFAKVLFTVSVIGEELKDSQPTRFQTGVDVRFSLFYKRGEKE